ncbi:MAG TPA: DoxX family protein [Sulfuricaulis sp.]|jgi:putative oxidoreductase|nr:DoxX family protein [Sulfuricaulis sp.]
MLNAYTAPYGALLLRLALGIMFIAHALLKLVVFTLPGTVNFFETVGFPGSLAYVVFGAELVGGVMLVLGIYTRWISAALIPILIGAVMVHAPNGWVFSAPNGGWEYPVFLAVACAVQALLGDGVMALRGTAVNPAPQSA